jgi:hypothetical protein
MKRLIPLFVLPLIAACADLTPGPVDENGVPIPPPPPPLPAQVQAAMPDGMPRDFVFEAANGCWAVGIEAGEPRTGRPLRDAAGNWVCNDGVIAPDQIAANAPAVDPAL